MTTTAGRVETVTTSQRGNPRLVWNRDVIDSLGVAAALTLGSYAIAAGLGWITHIDPLEVFAVFTSYSCTWLCVRQRRINYPIGAMSTLAYSILFGRQGLLASATLNAYLTPSLLYGWIRWRTDAHTRPVTRIERRWVPAYLAITAIAYIGAVAIAGMLGGTLAAADSVILVGSILAQFLLDNKKLENWIIWLVVNLVAIWVYVRSGLALAGLQYVFFLVTAVLGLMQWRTSLHEAQRAGIERAG